MGRGRTMKEIKITFDSEDINVQTGEMSGREFLTALGTAFIAGCKEFNIEPLSTIGTLMDTKDAAEYAVEDDEDDESLWYDDYDDYDPEYCDGCGEEFADCECGCTDWSDCD